MKVSLILTVNRLTISEDKIQSWENLLVHIRDCSLKQKIIKDICPQIPNSSFFPQNGSQYSLTNI